MGAPFSMSRVGRVYCFQLISCSLKLWPAVLGGNSPQRYSFSDSYQLTLHCNVKTRGHRSDHEKTVCKVLPTHMKGRQWTELEASLWDMALISLYNHCSGQMQMWLLVLQSPRKSKNKKLPFLSFNIKEWHLLP